MIVRVASEVNVRDAGYAAREKTVLSTSCTCAHPGCLPDRSKNNMEMLSSYSYGVLWPLWLLILIDVRFL